MRNENESYIRGYQIDMVENKRRNDFDYKFSKKESFCFSLGNPLGKKDEMSKSEVFKMEMQEEYGLHFITVNGKYICIKEDYIDWQLNSEKMLMSTNLGHIPKR